MGSLWLLLNVIMSHIVLLSLDDGGFCISLQKGAVRLKTTFLCERPPSDQGAPTNVPSGLRLRALLVMMHVLAHQMP
jgi:hypothetical protein